MRTSKLVLVGACGMGNGHSSRQLNLVSQLQDRGHAIALITFGDGIAALHDAFPQRVPISVPSHYPGAWVAMTDVGIDITSSADNGRVLDTRGDAWNFALCEQVIAQLGGEPEVVLSDYEPASAQIAYMLGSRLITTEQQSKFLMYRTPDAGGYTRWQEAAKLRYFFPSADQRVSSSFFPIEWEPDDRYPGMVTEPIVRPDILELSASVDNESVVVYLSPYSPLHQPMEKVLAVFEAFPAIRFKVFTKMPVGETPQNVAVLQFDRPAFTSALASCSAVICTAGHQLISECVYLRKPVLAVPFDVYEQQFNAMMLERHGVGMRTQELQPAIVGEFLARREEFAVGADVLATKQFTGDSAGLLDRLGL